MATTTLDPARETSGKAPDFMSAVGLLSFPALFEPRSQDPTKEPRYSCSLIWNAERQAEAAFKEMEKRLMKAARQKFGSTLPPNMWWPIRDGAEKTKYPGYGPGTKFANFTTKFQPGIVDGKNQKVEVASDVFAGQWARVSYTIHAFDNKSKGVGLGLLNVQIVKKRAPRIDGRKSAEESFEAMDLDDDDDLVDGDDDDDDGMDDIPF